MASPCILFLGGRKPITVCIYWQLSGGFDERMNLKKFSGMAPTRMVSKHRL
uniref:Uncharacterized protein n=1 Tax=Nelumbo nucifera TaxID=4432 RepID=A0A822XL61_NELNU|nr:TPA_asm: hypothetical protein HUJ06_021916 [Nelumbo nucifera]